MRERTQDRADSRDCVGGSKAGLIGGIRCRRSGGKEAEIRFELQAGFTARRDVCAASRRFTMSSGERRVFPPNSERGGGRDSPFFNHGLSFLIKGKGLRDPPKPFSHGHLRRAANWNPGVRHSVAILDQTGRGHRRGFGFEFGPSLAISTEQMCSLNPCGVRTRGEYTKRSGRSGWAV